MKKNFFGIISFIFVQKTVLQVLPDACLVTFDNASVTTDPSNPNANMFICPSACFTREYRSNLQAYPLFGNVTYSGNSMICKAALHDGRVAPWNANNNTLFIWNASIESTSFLSTLRNGILSGKSLGPAYSVYQFQSNRINETFIPDIAIEHRQYIYNQDQSSSITCRSKTNLYPIEPIEIDQGWINWIENPLQYFTFPNNFTRNQSLSFCSNNNGTLMYWSNLTEQTNLQNVFSSIIPQLFRFQFSQSSVLNFFIGLKQINGYKQWESNVISYNQTLNSFFNSTVTNNFCTILQLTNNPISIQLVYHDCDNTSMFGYPFCRLLPMADEDQGDFIYRLETDTSTQNLAGIIDFCAELGGYPIYANSAYEWQIVQEIMLLDPNFNLDYVYTGLLSPTKSVTNAYWLPTNTSYNSTLNYVWFASNRGADRIGFHLSKANGESYYGLYDINPYTVLNTLRFCRKPDPMTIIQTDNSCDAKSCTSTCLNISLPNESYDERFGFYSCLPTTSLVGIVYTQSFPQQGDFIRPNLPMDYGVVLRRPATDSFSLNFQQTTNDTDGICYEYIDFDRTSPSNDIIRLTCNLINSNNRTMSGILLRQYLNTLISVAIEERRMSGHHFRYIDYEISDGRCRYQGVYHPYVNQCICAPGYYGSDCQYTCPPGYYGQTCDFACHGDDDYCKGLLICLPDPYGCTCYTGWYGTYCNISCPYNKYGPNCAYDCPCSNCNRFSGICDCNGTECYQGIYTRPGLQSRCPPPSSSTSLALLIILPIVGVAILISIVALILYWKIIHSKSDEIYSPSGDIFSENL